MATFNVTYEIVTQESAEYGEADESGFVCEDVTLREAIEALGQTRTNRVDGIAGIEANDSRIGTARWITVDNGMEYETGAHESRSLHMPDSLTSATRRRIYRLIKES